MGAIGSILAGGILGVGASARERGAQTQPPAGAAAAIPPSPPPPYTTDDAQAAMSAAREKEAAAARLRREQSRTVFTSGLGAAGLAATNKKQLLGE